MEVIRDRSSKYVRILAPTMVPRLLNPTSMYLPNRDEFSFRTVLAFPNASCETVTRNDWWCYLRIVLHAHDFSKKKSYRCWFAYQDGTRLKNPLFRGGSILYRVTTTRRLLLVTGNQREKEDNIETCISSVDFKNLVRYQTLETLETST